MRVYADTSALIKLIITEDGSDLAAERWAGHASVCSVLGYARRARRSLQRDWRAVFAPGGGHTFFEELGLATRTESPDRTEIAAIFERHGMSSWARR